MREVSWRRIMALPNNSVINPILKEIYSRPNDPEPKDFNSILFFWKIPIASKTNPVVDASSERFPCSSYPLIWNSDLQNQVIKPYPINIKPSLKYLWNLVWWIFSTNRKYSHQQPKCITENKIRNVHWLINNPASITTTKTAAVNVRVLNVCQLNAMESIKFENSKSEYAQLFIKLSFEFRPEISGFDIRIYKLELASIQNSGSVSVWIFRFSLGMPHFCVSESLWQI